MRDNSKQTAVVQYALEPGAVELREMPVPAIGREDVLMKVAAVSVCGSEIHQMYNTHTWPVNVPVILGHEFSGTVVEVGDGVKSYAEGDRVVSETAAEICGECVPCRSGRYNLCPGRKGFGYGVHGAMTSFVRVPARCLHHIPDTLPFYHGCLAEPCSVAYHAMCVNSSIRPGDSVVVIGPGPIGLLCLRLAALSGAYPLVMVGITADTARLETARELGATHVVNADTQDLNEFVRALAPLGADLVCDASGASGPLQAALTVTAPDGQITKVGWSPKQAPIDINPLVQKNMRLQGSFSHTYPMWEKVIHLMASGNMHLDKIIGLKTNLDDWRLAFDSMHQGKVIKSVLLPEN